MTTYKTMSAIPEDARSAASPRAHLFAFTRSEWKRLAGLYGAVALLHVWGWGLFLYYASRHPSLVGAGLVAYLLGLRHAFDADHIAAVDDTVRYLMQKGGRPLGVGFFFSLGHSTIVFLVAVALVIATNATKEALPLLQGPGMIVGASVSGVFLWVMGVLNLLVLLDILKVWRQAKREAHSHAHLDALLARRGLINRVLGQRLRTFVGKSWQMYPVGVLFGLGFETATEVSLLAMTVGASAGALPAAATLSLPILFAAGMSALDTTDGVLMAKAYDWAFVNPLRKIFYNITLTSMSIAAALVIGTIELLRVLAAPFRLEGPLFDFVTTLDFVTLGCLMAAAFVVAWCISAAAWRFGRIEERHAGRHLAHTHEHAHEGGRRHSHIHFH